MSDRAEISAYLREKGWELTGCDYWKGGSSVFLYGNRIKVCYAESLMTHTRWIAEISYTAPSALWRATIEEASRP